MADPRNKENDACRARRFQLMKRQPGEWLDRIADLAADLQVEIAAIVWWDFFSQNTGGQRARELERLTWKPSKHTSAPSRLAQALIGIGYTTDAAERRVK